ncbi:hypothetical protein TNCV_5020751 [Trichonephila clavipes]|nr:hypothetical protein TNCV_5020751 [Trichonephila clavipes]
MKFSSHPISFGSDRDAYKCILSLSSQGLDTDKGSQECLFCLESRKRDELVTLGGDLRVETAFLRVSQAFSSGVRSRDLTDHPFGEYLHSDIHRPDELYVSPVVIH